MAFGKKKDYTEFEKMLYYDNKAGELIKKNELATKNYRKNWWKRFYYEARGNGMNHEEAYSDATQAMKDDFPVLENLIISDFDFKKFEKRNKNLRR